MKKISIVLAIVLAVLFSFSACSRRSGSSDSKKIKVGITVYDLANSYWVMLINGAREKCDELGIELILDDPKSNSAAQVTALENFIAMGVDAIIVAPLDPAACEGVVRDAMSRGIKVIAQSSKTDSHDVWVSADEFNMGQVNGQGAGRWIAERYGADAKIKCAVFGMDKIPTQILRGDGMEAGIKEFAPNVTIIRQDANTTADGQRVADALLQANPDLQVIVCINDSAAIGALSAVQGANRDNDDFYIGGIDATVEALEVIEKGNSFRATVDLIPYENGRIDIELIMKLLNGESVPETYVIPAKMVSYEDL
jgi:ABC-type sugar transport system substrate-binding protein